MGEDGLVLSDIDQESVASRIRTLRRSQALAGPRDEVSRTRIDERLSARKKTVCPPEAWNDGHRRITNSGRRFERIDEFDACRATYGGLGLVLVDNR